MKSKSIDTLIQKAVDKRAEWSAKLSRYNDKLTDLDRRQEAAYNSEDEAELVAIAEERLKVQASIDALNLLVAKRSAGFTPEEVTAVWAEYVAGHNQKMQRILQRLESARSAFLSAYHDAADLQSETAHYFHKLDGSAGIRLHGEMLGITGSQRLNAKAYTAMGGNISDYWETDGKLLPGGNLFVVEE